MYHGFSGKYPLQIGLNKLPVDQTLGLNETSSFKKVYKDLASVVPTCSNTPPSLTTEVKKRNFMNGKKGALIYKKIIFNKLICF